MAIVWTGVTYQNGAYGSAASSPDAGTNTTTVRLRGQVTVKPGLVAFNLPAGQRPSVALSLDCVDIAGRNCTMTVATTGDATFSAKQLTGNESLTVVLDGMTYAGEA